MNQTAKRVVIGLALLAVPAGVVVARHADHKHHFGHHGMFNGGPGATPETRVRLLDGRIAMAKETLKLSPDQQKLWAPVEEKIRAAAARREADIKERQDRRAARAAEKGADGKSAEAKPAERPSMIERLEQRASRMSERAQTFSEVVAVVKPLYATFTEEQKAAAGPLLREIAFHGGRKGQRHAGRGHGWGGWHGKRHHGHGPDGGDRGGSEAGPDDDDTPAR